MRLRLTIAVGSIIALAMAALPAYGVPSTLDAPRRLAGMTAETMREPWRVPGDDSRDHLAFTLRLTNLLTVPTVVTAVSVRDQGGSRLQLLTADALAGRVQALASNGPTTPLAPSASAVVLMDVPIAASRHVTELRMSVSYALAPGSELPATLAGLGINWIVQTAPTPVSAFVPPVMAPPLQGPDWVNANQWGDPATGHSGARMTKNATLHSNEVFAIDFIRMRDGMTFSGDGSANEQYYAWGAPILSSTDGTVITVLDGMPAIAPGAFPTDLTSVEQAGGNQAVVKAADGVYILYGHMQQGSVAVKVGDKVRVGQRLGLLGNSGNTNGAHLHFQVSDGPDVFNADSIPFVFASFVRTGVIAVDAANNVSVTGPATRFRDVYPTTLSVLRFAR
jgi:hypothetical protein